MIVPQNSLLQLLYTALLISAIPPSVSKTKKVQITADHEPWVFLDQFGFDQNGHVSVYLNNVSYTSKHPNASFNPALMGFFLLKVDSHLQFLNEQRQNFFPNDGEPLPQSAHDFCLLDSHLVKVIFGFDALTINTPYNGSFTVDDADKYSLVFGNCETEFGVTMSVTTEMYNLNGAEKDFLPAGQTQLPKLYFLFSLMFLGFLVLWVFICVKERAARRQIHIMMGALLLFKLANLLCAAEEKVYISRTGTPHGWDTAFFVSGICKAVMLVTVIVLIGTGWSFVKPSLQGYEKKVLAVVIPLQITINYACYMMNVADPLEEDYLMVYMTLLIINGICCLAVLFPILSTIRSLRNASQVVGKATTNLLKLALFRRLYAIVVGYLFIIRFLVLVLATFLSYRHEWVIPAFSESASLCCYAVVFYMFKPDEKNLYSAIEDDDEEIGGAEIVEENWLCEDCWLDVFRDFLR